MNNIFTWLHGVKENFKSQSPLAQMIMLIILAVVLINAIPWGALIWTTLTLTGAVTLLKLLFDRGAPLFEALVQSFSSEPEPEPSEEEEGNDDEEV